MPHPDNGRMIEKSRRAGAVPALDTPPPRLRLDAPARIHPPDRSHATRVNVSQTALWTDASGALRDLQESTTKFVMLNSWLGCTESGRL